MITRRRGIFLFRGQMITFGRWGIISWRQRRNIPFRLCRKIPLGLRRKIPFGWRLRPRNAMIHVWIIPLPARNVGEKRFHMFVRHWTLWIEIVRIEIVQIGELTVDSGRYAICRTSIE